MGKHAETEQRDQNSPLVEEAFIIVGGQVCKLLSSYRQPFRNVYKYVNLRDREKSTQDFSSLTPMVAAANKHLVGLGSPAGFILGFKGI